VTAFARGGLAAVEALERARFDVFSGGRSRLARGLARTRSEPCPVMVEGAYAEVERLTWQRARNFAYGIMLLPRPKRRAIAAVYAFARQVDDIADGPLPEVEKRVLLEQLRGSSTPRPARRRCSSRSPTPATILDPDRRASGADQWRRPGHGADALCRFRRAARILRARRRLVGRACVAVYGADEPERAETLGIALQLINIVRDVAEDWSLGASTCAGRARSFGVEEDDIASGLVTPEWGELMGFQAERAGAPRRGLTLLDHLDRRSAACVATFAGLYRSTLDRIEQDGFDVSAGRRRFRRSPSCAWSEPRSRDEGGVVAAAWPASRRRWSSWTPATT